MMKLLLSLVMISSLTALNSSFVTAQNRKKPAAAKIAPTEAVVPPPKPVDTSVFPPKEELTALISADTTASVPEIPKEWGERNPFDLSAIKPQTPASAIFSQDKGPRLILNGILWGVEKPSVIINDKVYGVGDKVSPSAIVKSIAENSVVLVYLGKDTTLSLHSKDGGSPQNSIGEDPAIVQDMLTSSMITPQGLPAGRPQSPTTMPAGPQGNLPKKMPARPPQATSPNPTLNPAK